MKTRRNNDNAPCAGRGLHESLPAKGHSGPKHQPHRSRGRGGRSGSLGHTPSTGAPTVDSRELLRCVCWPEKLTLFQFVVGIQGRSRSLHGADSRLFGTTHCGVHRIVPFRDCARLWTKLFQHLPCAHPAPVLEHTAPISPTVFLNLTRLSATTPAVRAAPVQEVGSCTPTVHDSVSVTPSTKNPM